MAVSVIGEDKKKALNLAIAQIEKNCGKGSIMKMGSSERVRIDAIPTGAINLDAAIGVGGIPRGRVTEIYGPESSGKTTLCLHVVANAQRAGGVAAYIDAEHALDTDYAQKLGVWTSMLFSFHSPIPVSRRWRSARFSYAQARSMS
jgi:recombination protein RecA